MTFRTRLCRATACLLLACGGAPLHAQRWGLGPDGAVGSEQERLASAIDLDSTGTVIPGAGLVAHVRLAWTGTAGFIARSVYRDATSDKLAEMAQSDAGRSGFYNFSAWDPQIRLEPGNALPIAIEYDIRQTMMAVGVGGRAWRFHLPMPRVFRRLVPTPVKPSPMRADDPSLPEEVRRVLGATPPPGVLPVGDVGRFTARASYALPLGSWTSPPENRDIDTDFARFSSRYAVEEGRVTAERTVIVKALAIPVEREVELETFFQAVEADRNQSFLVHAVRPDARSDADRLNDEGTVAIDRDAMLEATDILRRAVQADSTHRWAWFNLGSAYLALRNVPDSIQALERALTVNAADPHVRINLGQAYDMAARPDDAERTLKAAVEHSPWSGWALQTLTGFYVKHRRFAESVVYGERMTVLAPKIDGAFLSLGVTYLELGQVAEAVSAFQRGVLTSDNGLTSNNAAWALAERGVALDVAWRLADSGIDKIIAAETSPTTQTPRLTPLQTTQELAAIWDTAGWVRFKQGNAADAVPWLEASWRLANRAVLAEHLGDALASLGRDDEAAIAYSWASDAADATSDLSAKLAKTAGDRVDDIRRRAAAALRTQRTISLPSAPAVSASGDVVVTYQRTGRVTDLQPATGATLPASILEAIRATTMPVTAPPDGRDYRLTRTAAVTCSAGECSLVLAVPTPAGR